MIGFSGTICVQHTKKRVRNKINAFVNVNNDFFGHPRCNSSNIFNRDFVTHRKHWQITSPMTRKVDIQGNLLLSFFYITTKHSIESLSHCRILAC